MKIKMGRAAFIGISVFSAFCVMPVTAYADDELFQRVSSLFIFDGFAYHTLVMAVLLIFSLLLSLFTALRYRRVKARLCSDFDCERNPVYSTKLSRREAARMRSRMRGGLKKSQHNEDVAYFSAIETPEELINRPTPEDTARSMSLRASGITPVVNSCNEVRETAQGLALNQDSRFYSYQNPQAARSMDLTLEMIQKVLGRLDQQDALLHASLARHSGNTGQFAVFAGGQKSPVTATAAMGGFMPPVAVAGAQIYQGRHSKSAVAAAQNDIFTSEPVIKEVYVMRHSKPSFNEGEITSADLRKIS